MAAVDRTSASGSKADTRSSRAFGIGVGIGGFLKKMLEEPFDAQPVAASVCQLGNFGTARKELRTLVLKP